MMVTWMYSTKILLSSTIIHCHPDLWEVSYSCGSIYLSEKVKAMNILPDPNIPLSLTKKG